MVNLLRCAWAGSQRYGALVWSGDIHSDWQTFRRQAVSYTHLDVYKRQGLEVYSSYHKKEDVEWFHKLAEELGMLETMGSDFHGKTKHSVIPGGTGGDQMEEKSLSLLDYLLKMHRIF